MRKIRRKDEDTNSLKPSNGCIAFSQDDEHLIAYGATYDEVVANAEKQGVADLIVVKLPNSDLSGASGLRYPCRIWPTSHHAAFPE